MKIEELAGCLIIENGKILLVKEAKDWYWKIPSGKVDRDESLEEATKRETREETGFEVEIGEHFNTYDFEFKDRNFRLHVYRAKITGGIISPQKDDNVRKAEWFPVESLNQEITIPSNKLIYQDLRWKNLKILKH